MEGEGYYQIGGITIKLDSDVPFTRDTLHPKFGYFRIQRPGTDIVRIHHHLFNEKIEVPDTGKAVYYRPPWAIFKNGDSWIYLTNQLVSAGNGWGDIAVFNSDYSRGDFYHKDKNIFELKNLTSLTFFPTDQVLISQLMASRDGLLLHSGAVILNSSGIMFIGHSGAGKSTTMKMLKDKAEILCDDRNIVRRSPDGFKLYGTWSHGEIPIVSASSAPLKAIFFLKKSEINRLVPLNDKKEIQTRLLRYVIKPFLTAGWWDNALALIRDIANGVPCYEMEFDKSGDIVPEIERLVPRS